MVDSSQGQSLVRVEATGKVRSVRGEGREEREGEEREEREGEEREEREGERREKRHQWAQARFTVNNRSIGGADLTTSHNQQFQN